MYLPVRQKPLLTPHNACYLESHVGSQQTSFVSDLLLLLLQGKFTHCLYFLFTYCIKQYKKSWCSTISVSLGQFGERVVVEASTGLDLTLIRQILLTTWDNWLENSKSLRRLRRKRGRFKYLAGGLSSVNQISWQDAAGVLYHAKGRLQWLISRLLLK